jgi:MFS family permease
MVMAVTVFTLAAGYFFGGFLGDTFFQRTRRGRIIISLIGIVSGALLLFAALSVPLGNPVLFSLLLALTGLFTPFAAPNITATIQDITEPELRSTAQALKSFIEQGGAAAAPLIAGLIAMHSSLTKAILYTCIGTWLLCAALLYFALRTVPEDMEELHETLLFRRTRLARTAHGERLSEIAD